MASEKIRRLAAAKKGNEVGGRNQSTPLSKLVEIETLFVQKLSEKFKLTERDISRAFKRFDTDVSGFLSTHELCKAIGIFVPGVPEQQVSELAQRYDVDGDGQISMDEFTQLLMSRSSPNQNDWLTIDYLTSQRTNDDSRYDEEQENNQNMSTEMIDDDYEQQPTAEYKAKIFMQNVRAMLSKRAMDIRSSNKLPSSTRLGQHTSSLIETIARDILTRAFQPYCTRLAGKSSAGGGGGGGGVLRVDFDGFSNVMKKFVFPGAPLVTNDTLMSLFLSCGTGNVTSSRAITNIDPEVLADMIFDKGGDKINKFGFVSSVQPASHTGRPTVQSGPLIQKMTFQATQEITRKLSDIPHRFMTRRCRTALSVPSNFDLSLIERSCTLPAYECQRDYVFGLTATPYAGPPIYSAFIGEDGRVESSRGKARGAAELLIYACAALGVVHDLSTHTQRFFEGHDDDICCLTVTNDRSLAASGQMGRRPEVLIWATSLCTPAGSPCLLSNDPADRIPGLVTRIGKGFFERGVCAIEFSYDNRYLCGVSCDDKHTLGIWLVTTGALIASMPSANGIPPQIKCIRWSPRPQNNAFICNDHGDEDTDLIVTAGERHLKFWSFCRTTHLGRNREKPVLAVRASSIGKLGDTIEAAKTHRCVVILDPSMSVDNNTSSGGGMNWDTTTTTTPRTTNSLYAVTGGDNGGLFLWRAATCVRAGVIIAGGISSLAAYGGDKVVCGGANGVVKIVDLRSMAVLQSFSALPPTVDALQDAAGVAGALSAAGGGGKAGGGGGGKGGTGGRPSSAGSTARPNSASQRSSGTRPMTAGGGSQVAGSKSTGNLDQHTLSVIRRNRGGVAGPKTTLTTPSRAENTPIPTGMRVSADVLGLALVYEANDQSVSSVIAVTGLGRVIRIELNALLGGSRFAASLALNNSNNHTSSGTSDEPLFCFHTGPLWALATEKKITVGGNSSFGGKLSTGRGALFATGGDDRYLMMWCGRRRHFLTRIRAPAPIRCLDFDGLTNSYIAVGMAGGIIAVYGLTTRAPSSSGGSKPPAFQRLNSGVPLASIEYNLSLLVTRRDCKEDISDLKFSPNNRMLAVGSHDQMIDIYATTFETPNSAGTVSCQLKVLRRLKGHSSFITHLDWSLDNRLLRSCCASYELLFWDVGVGRQFLSTLDSMEADTQWQTETCVLGFPVMGIWPPDADGTDVNSVDVLVSKGLVATGDDSSRLNLFNYPCVAKHAPRRTYGGHSSHVMTVKFLPGTTSSSTSSSTLDASPDRLLTVGGNDCSAMLWRIVPVENKQSWR